MSSYNIRLREMTDADPTADQPDDIGVKLKPHQLTMLAAARNLEHNRLPYELYESHESSNDELSSYIRSRIGIICDKVGAGKSYVVLSLVLDDTPISVEPMIKSYYNGLVVTSAVQHKPVINTNILVIPHSLCSQWQTYITNFKPDLSYLMIHRNRHFVKFDDTNISEFKLIVVTCTMYARLADYLSQQNVVVRRVFYDEVDDMNCQSESHIESEFHWFVTASYENLLYPRGHTSYNSDISRYIENATGFKHRGFLRNMFGELISSMGPSVFRRLFLKNCDAYIHSSLHLPDLTSQIVECRALMLIHVLDGLVDRQIIQLLHANDIQGAIKLISAGHQQSEDCIISILISKLQRQLKNTIISIQYTDMLVYENEEEKHTELQALTVKKVELERKISFIHERIRETNTCPICYEDITNKCVLNCCSNAYCFKCISYWLGTKQPAERKCPFCKACVTIQDNLYVVDNTITSVVEHHADIEMEDTRLISPSNDKFKNLEGILKTVGFDKKYLIFSSYDNTFQTVSEMLTKMGIKYSYLKGNGYIIRNIVDAYKNGTTQVLLVNTKHYGSGLNLENTTDLIMFHKFDTDIEKQVIGRANRYGRTEPLRVWYLLHANEHY